MKLFYTLFIGVGFIFLAPNFAYAASNNDAAAFTSNTLSVLIALASLASAFFLIRGAFQYITSTGKPEEVDSAKKTIRNALIGLVLVISAGVFSSLLQNAFITPSNGSATSVLTLKPIQPVTPSNGLTQVIIDAMIGFIQTIIQSAAKPLIDGIISFLTITPSLLSNSVVFNFWLVIVGIVDSLFAIVIAILGFNVMSASTFGFDELELKHLLPRIGLAFLAANTSIFIIEWVISICNMLIQAVLGATGGLTHAWVLYAISPQLITGGQNGVGGAVLITLIFMLLFVILSIMLLIFYISRLIVISVGAVLSPFICLLWLLPGFTDFATISIKTYLITIFTVFVHVVIIQLASSFLTLPGQSGTNSLISILVGVATFFTLLKVPGMIIQFAFYSATSSVVRKLGGEITNVFSSSKSKTEETETRTNNHDKSITPRKRVAL
jgi:hypothetical protein